MELQKIKIKLDQLDFKYGCCNCNASRVKFQNTNMKLVRGYFFTLWKVMEVKEPLSFLSIFFFH